jgi:tripartite-type tricarboxylate transporter receptor subunit TctC
MPPDLGATAAMNRRSMSSFFSVRCNSTIPHSGGEALHPFPRTVSCGIHAIDRAVTSKIILGSSCAHSAFSVVHARGARAAVFVCGFTFASGAGAQAQSYPSKSIRMIVISSAAGSTDIIARAVGRALGESMGQSIVLDNRPGGGGIIASEMTAKARPDGYTILMANTSHSVQPSLHAKLPYDPIKDFAPVSLVALTHSLLLVNTTVPLNTVKELIDFAKAHPGKLKYPSGTNGSSAHIGVELLKLMAGIDLVRVPYKGTAENVNALISGEAQVGFVTMPSALPHVSSGRLRVLAIGGPRRSRKLPDVPTVAETLPGFDIGTWLGILAPAHTPQPIVMRLNAEIVKMANNAEAREQAASQGAELVSTTPQEFAAYIQTQIDKFGKVVKATGMRSD